MSEEDYEQFVKDGVSLCGILEDIRLQVYPCDWASVFIGADTVGLDSSHRGWEIETLPSLMTVFQKSGSQASEKDTLVL